METTLVPGLISPHKDRSEWISARRGGIGASDVSRNALEVYLSKLGLYEIEPTPEMAWGLRHEPAIAAAYTERTGHALDTTLGLTRNPREPWMFATPDAIDLDLMEVVEFKTSRFGDGFGPDGSDEVPSGYICQVHWQAECLSLSSKVCDDQAAHVAALIGGSDFRVYHIPIRREITDLLIKIGRDLWRRIEAREPPEPDWTHPLTPALVQALHVPEPGKVIALDDHEALTLVREYQFLGQSASETKKKLAEIKARVCTMMGDAQTATLCDGSTVTRNKVRRRGHMVEASEYVNFTVSKAKK